MVPLNVRTRVEFDYVFPSGCLFLSCEKVTDWNKRGKGDDHAIDPDTGLRVWLVTVTDLHRDENATFPRKSFEVKVKVLSDHKPVPPTSEIPGYPPPVAFTDLMISPWMDNSKCTGKVFDGGSHKCRAQLAWTIRAGAMVSPAELLEAVGAKAKR